MLDFIGLFAILRYIHMILEESGMGDVNIKNKIKNVWKVLGTTQVANLVSIVALIISLYTLSQINVVKDFTVENSKYVQTGNIVNNGASVEDMDYISTKNIEEMMDKAYGAEDIIKLVDEIPNLSFSLYWSGSQEEYDAIDWDKMPPHIQKVITADNRITLIVD